MHSGTWYVRAYTKNSELSDAVDLAIAAARHSMTQKRFASYVRETTFLREKMRIRK